ncbi:MAG TPA: alpha-ketoglutarate-dependent dioxygenase AlkB [Microvirga sp.]|nr:alpha-ketoglutarate-dependent dioxygenase AlkB [Microvirga sp.]
MQQDLFGAGPALPEGFRYEESLIAQAEERALVAWMADLPFRAFEFHGHVGRRRVVSFGWEYDFSRERAHPAADMPDALLPLRAKAAAFAGIAPEAMPHALVTEYEAGAAIGWHRDKGVFGDVVGVSLLSPCTFRLRRKAGRTWERASVTAAPRSAYLLRGPARTEWEHSIPAVETLRYSITFRTMRDR